MIMKTDKTDNEWIAEFMGWERYSNYSFKCPNLYPSVNNNSHGWTTFTYDQLDFATRWDWLMPVVEKIDNLDDGKYIVTIDPMITIISDNGESVVNECQAFDGRIKNTYGAVVEFIKWHNSQPKP